MERHEIIEIVITGVSKLYGYNWKEVALKYTYQGSVSKQFKSKHLIARYVIVNLLNEFIDKELIIETMDVQPHILEKWLSEGNKRFSEDQRAMIIYFKVRKQLEDKMKFKTTIL